MIYTGHGRLHEPMSSARAVNGDVMGRDTIQDRVAIVQSAAYDRAGYDVSYLLFVMRERIWLSDRT